jgi:hypothetical protein
MRMKATKITSEIAVSRLNERASIPEQASECLDWEGNIRRRC